MSAFSHITYDKRMVVDPLFYDALSGEFTPPQDGKRRAHTLGRLAYAALTKGTFQPREISEPNVSYFYNPSWAPAIDADISCIPNLDATTKLDSIYLVSPNDDELIVSHDVRVETVDGVRVVRSALYLHNAIEEDREFSLELGDSLTEARAAVTQSAQLFFDLASQS